MNDKIKEYLSLWTVKRFLQLLFGLYFFWEYTKESSVFALFIGVLMSYQAVMNVGCFSSKGCSVPQVKNNKPYCEDEEIEFEEVE